ncbi:MAG: hypothetical protein CSA33_06665 [Desulfobulbus propionicus]|nr:MAG: hypothetical protein CSA33_06665 [Desulfobulbus propionicus]
MKRTLVVALAGLCFLASCAKAPPRPASTLGGAAGGALVGQAIGHDTEATLTGAAVGTVLGYIVGSTMDQYDKRQLNHVYERGMSNQRLSWYNPDTGNQYRIIPKPAYRRKPGGPSCRRAQIEAIINGKRQVTYSTACRDRNGRWHLY